MKRLNLIALLLTALFLFTACNNHSNIPESPNHSKYIYRMADGSSLDWDTAMGMPIKINLVSGKTTPVCIDPLCMHDDADCPFYECFGCVADGTVIFFRRGWISRNEGGFEGSEKLCTYNAATGEVRVLKEYTDSIVYAGIHENVLYYYTAAFSSENDTWICTYQLHMADGVSGKITDLPLENEYTTEGGFTSNSDYPNILSIDDAHIYWMEYSGISEAIYYQTDRMAQNKQMLAGTQTVGGIFHGGYAYSVTGISELIDPNAGRTPENMLNTYALHRTSLADQTKETIAEGLATPNFIITDRYIFTLEGLSAESKGSKQLLHGCKVCRINHDGSNLTVIAETNEYDFMYGEFSTNEILLDCYEDEETTYLALAFCMPDEDGGLKKSPDTLILDTATAEFSVSEYSE